MFKRFYFVLVTGILLLTVPLSAQTNSPAPYCNGAYANGSCLQGGPVNTPGNGVNDFIDFFSTLGGNTNITNNGSGCNQSPNNYVNFCQHYLQVNPGQTITCVLQSGIIYPQGFAIFIDWNQDNTFSVPAEQVAATTNVPGAAQSTTLTFIVPPNIPNGTYRLRVRCAYNTPGTNITPCGTFAYGETEDYNIFVGPIPANSAIISGTAVATPVVCVGQQINFSFATSYATPLTYTWTGPNSFSSTSSNPSIPTPSTSSSGIYTVLVSNSLCPITRTVSTLVVPYPTFSIAPSSHVICQGGSLLANITNLSGNPSQFSFQWTGPGSIFNPVVPFTSIQPPLLPANVPLSTVFYSISISPTIQSCPTTQIMSVLIQNPITPVISTLQPLCNTFPSVQLFATPGGGTWSANPAVSPNGFLTPSLALNGLNTVFYTHSIGTCTASSSGTFEVSKFHPATLTSSLNSCVLDAPFRLLNIVQDTTTGTWSGTNVNSLSSYFSPAGLATGNYTLNYNSPSSPNPLTCPASTTIVIPVFNPPIPQISAIAPKCNNATTVSLLASPPGGVWNNNSGVTPSGVQTPSLNQIGVNTVNYTAGQGTCTATSSRTFHVSQYNTAVLGASINPLCYNNGPINLLAIAQNSTGTWTGTNTTNNSFNPFNLPTGTYTLIYNTVSNPQPSLCPESSKLMVSVLNPVTPTISTMAPLCSRSAPVQLSVTPSIGNWVVSSYLNANGIFNPSLSPIGINAVQYMIGTSTCNAVDTKFISNEAFVPATIAQTLPELCDNSSIVSLSPLTLNNLGSWSGPGVSGLNFSPALAGTGFFNLVYKTASSPSNLCPDSDTLAVKVFSLAPPAFSTAGPFCTNALPFQLKVSPVGGIFAGTNSQATNLQGIFNPALAVIGNNLVSYSISSGPCIAYAQTTVMVEKFIGSELIKQPDAVYCQNVGAFNLLSFVQNTDGFWHGSGASNNMFDPSSANVGNNTLVYRTHSLPTVTLCPSSSTINIKVKEVPQVKAFSSTQSGCSPLVVTLNCPDYEIGRGNWSLGDGSVTRNGFAITHTFTSPGVYKVLYQYADAEARGCTASYTLPLPITVYESPVPDFSVDREEVFISEPQVKLQNHTSDLYGNQYLWTVQGQGQLFDLHPEITFQQIGLYRVNLQATSLKGCKRDITKTIEVKNNFNVFIPNSFTPNMDGTNDNFKVVFSPYGLDAATFELQIFDRWGHIVLSTKDPENGWDGTFQNKGAIELKEDSYNYRVRFRDLDGQIYHRSGTVLLLR